ncbi:MAG: M48 family metalloprotease [Acidobacteriota bacterium]|nr:M48 family metalloprotease [Acidobacteriota bacterium]MDH3529045.1 M48 family metalloprotease [Acidobacteriota bacterium]
MNRKNIGKQLIVLTLAWILVVTPLAITAQTKISMPKNKYKVEDDVKIGREYSAKVENEFPILRDSESTNYIQDVGRRLVSSIPNEFQEPQFQYQFKIVNARDINAFALPAGYLYVNRGMIQAAKNEGEMAGVIAHEVSHAALRHGTAQATKQTSLKNQILGIGAILGGAILGGQAGAQLGAIFAAGYQLRYSRQYETQADLLGARIMADAGYDPRDLANMFKTISGQSEGGRPPEWLSSHPDPDKRFATINREAELLRVSPNPIKSTRGFVRIQEKFSSMPQAPTMAEIEKGAKGNTGGGDSGGGGNTTPSTGMENGTYARTVVLPSSRTRSYNASAVRFRVPENWKEFPGQSDVWFAPEGAYGKDGITHGALMGAYQTQQTTLERATEDYIKGILQGNAYLSSSNDYYRFTINGRTAYATKLSGRSPITGNTEYALVYTAMLSNGNMFYFVGVAPERESTSYNRTFNNIVQSIRFTDRTQ